MRLSIAADVWIRSRFMSGIVSGAGPVPDLKGGDRRLVVFEQDDLEAVCQMRLFI